MTAGEKLEFGTLVQVTKIMADNLVEVESI
jgi:hypothetical protein